MCFKRGIYSWKETNLDRLLVKKNKSIHQYMNKKAHVNQNVISSEREKQKIIADVHTVSKLYRSFYTKSIQSSNTNMSAYYSRFKFK